MGSNDTKHELLANKSLRCTSQCVFPASHSPRPKEEKINTVLRAPWAWQPAPFLPPGCYRMSDQAMSRYIERFQQIDCSFNCLASKWRIAKPFLFKKKTGTKHHILIISTPDSEMERAKHVKSKCTKIWWPRYLVLIQQKLQGIRSNSHMRCFFDHKYPKKWPI